MTHLPVGEENVLTHAVFSVSLFLMLPICCMSLSGACSIMDGLFTTLFGPMIIDGDQGHKLEPASQWAEQNEEEK